MLELGFTVEGARARSFCAAPELSLAIGIACREPVHAILLRAQVQIEAPRRGYSPREAEGLRDLFGAPDRFASTLRSVVWATPSAQVPAFRGATTVEIALPCGFDFSLAAVKLLHALEGGEVPLLLLFSGTVFFAGERGLEVAPIPASAEARFAMPLAALRETIDHYYPRLAPLALRRDLFDRLNRYKQQHQLRSFDEAVERLLGREGAP